MHRTIRALPELAASLLAVSVDASLVAQVPPTWTRQATVPSARYDPAMAHDSQRGRTVMFGGYNSTFLGDTWEWNGSSWTRVSSTGPSARYDHAMAYDTQRGVTVMFGGNNSGNIGNTW